MMCAIVSIAALGLAGCGEEEEDVPNVTITFDNQMSDLTVESVSVGSGKADNIAPNTSVTRKIYSGKYPVKFTAGGVTIDATDPYNFEENMTYYVRAAKPNGSVKWTIFSADNSSPAYSVGKESSIEDADPGVATDLSSQNE